MKRIKTQTNINQLLHDLPESTQQVISGGTGVDGSVRFLSDSVTSTYQRESSGGSYYGGYVKVSPD